MKNITLQTAVAAAFMGTAAPAMAQSIPPATIAVVDLNKITAQCNACKTASAALTSQINALRARQKALATPLEAEAKTLQAAVTALAGKAPDAALQSRVQAFQAKQQAAQQEVARQEQQIQRNQTYIQQQIGAKLGPVYQQVMQRRGANMMVEIGSTLASAASLDVSNDILTALNAALTTVQTIAPAQAAPQGR